MNPIIEGLLIGDISMDDFLEELRKDHGLQEDVRNLLPNGAKDNPRHEFWSHFPYGSLERNGFDFYRFLFWQVRPNEKFSRNLNVFSRLKKAYRYYCPSVQCTSKYDEAFDIYLDAINDCFDGPEVRILVDHIIADSLQLDSKSKRSKHAKAIVKKMFHVENRKRPHWTQGPEWPMGSRSPMAYIGRRKDGEAVNYEFRDVDTGETRIVKQYY